MKFLSSIILLTLCILIQSAHGDTWYNFAPYNSTTCTAASAYGLGYSLLGDTYCTSNIEGTSNFKTYTSSGTIKIAQYITFNNPTACTTYAQASNYTLNTCQDAQFSGFTLTPSQNNFQYAKNFYVTSSATPVYPTTVGTTKNVLLFTFYAANNCSKVIAYQYYNGYNVLHDAIDTTITYNFYCSGNVPYRQYCETGYCDPPESMTQTCHTNISTYLSKTVTCV